MFKRRYTRQNKTSRIYKRMSDEYTVEIIAGKISLQDCYDIVDQLSTAPIEPVCTCTINNMKVTSVNDAYHIKQLQQWIETAERTKSLIDTLVSRKHITVVQLMHAEELAAVVHRIFSIPIHIDRVDQLLKRLRRLIE